MGTDGRTANSSHGNSYSNVASEHVSSVFLKTTDGPLPQNEMWHAEALPWECGNEGKSCRALHHSIPTSRITYPLEEIRQVKDELSAPPVADYDAMDGDTHCWQPVQIGGRNCDS